MSFLQSASPPINMNALTQKKKKIQQILNTFETGKPEGDYGNVSIFYDGPNGVKQLTYGKSQTTEYGNLAQLLKLYAVSSGDFSAQIGKKIPSLKKGAVHDKEFVQLLRSAGNDPVMKKCQDEFFDKAYWEKAVNWAEANKFTLPLSMLVIYDSFIHSGSILGFLRKRFPAKVPSDGGNEKEWIEQYLTARQNWLSSHSNKILRKTIYRTRDMMREIKEGDWNLETEFVANGIKIK